MNYDNLTVESIAQYCAEKSGFKINKADLESQIQHLIDIEKAEQLILSGVSQQRELLNALADDFNDSTDTYVGQKTIEKTLKAFNCG
jgi:hypothetical protein